MKKASNCTHQNEVYDTEFGRGKIRDNALKAVVTSPLFKQRIEKAKKGKGSFNRKMKHKGESPIQKPLNRGFRIGLFLTRALYFIKVN